MSSLAEGWRLSANRGRVGIVPRRRRPSARRSGRIAVLLATAIVSLVTAAAAPVVPPPVEPFFVFKPIAARGSTAQDRATIQAKWDALAGMTPAISAALTEYEMNPGMASAIGVLHHYEAFSKNADLRAAFHAADQQVFLSLDAAKYELVMQTQAAMKRDGHDIGYAMRVGSSGERHRAWLKWAADGGDLNAMPAADLNKQFQSDDDVTNFPSRSADSFTAGELLNGETAAGYFLKVTQEYGMAMHPGIAMIEFLSPTKAWDSRAPRAALPGGRVGGGINADDSPILPTYLMEWVLSDPEKYNGHFSVEQLDQWAYSKGVITENVLDPASTTRPYRDVYARYNPEGRTEPRGYPEADLFGWMTNQVRQLFGTHQGELKYLKKYTERMSDAWRWFQQQERLPPEYVSWVQPPAGFPELSLEELEDYNRRLLVAAHEKHLDLLVERMRAGIDAHLEVGADGARSLNATLETLTADPQLDAALDMLALAYTNLDADTRSEFDRDLQARIDAAESGGDAYAGHLARYLKAARADVVRSVGSSLRNAAAFRDMRQRLGSRLNEHLRAIDSSNLDRLLLRVATGEFTRGEIGLVWDGTTFVERVLSPDDVKREVEVIENLGRTFGWKDATLARRLKEYLEGEPHVAVEMILRLHQISDPASLRPITVRWTDETGATRTSVIEPTRVEQGLSLGLASFKAALKGGQFIKKVYGQFNDGYQLFTNLKAVYWDAGNSSPEQMARAHAQVVASAVGLVDVVEHFGYKAPGVIGGLGSTLGAAASLSGGAFMDDGAARQLTLALATDLLTAYVPQIATVLFLKEVATGIHTSWTLSAASGDIVDLLLENGIWDVDSTGVKPPKLEGWIRWDGAGNQEFVADVREIARRQPSPWDQGVTLRTSRTTMNPREALLDVAYVGNQIESDQLIALTLDAARAAAVNANVGGFLNPVPGTREWTTEWIRDDWGIAPTIDDDTRLDFGASVPVYLVRDDPGLWGDGNNDFEAHRQAAARRVFGRLVADVWGRRQVILEDKVLPPLIEEAARRKLKELVANNDVLEFQEDLDRLDARAAEIDKATWPLIARSADPFAGTGYDADADLPIRDAFRERTADARRELAELVRDIRDPQRRIEAVVLDSAGARAVADAVMQSIVDELLAIESRYNSIRILLESNRGWVKQNGPDILEYHAPVSADVDGDSTAVSNWAGAYRDEEARVAKDIGARLYAFHEARGLQLARDLDSGFDAIDAVFAGAHDVVYNVTGQGDWLHMALSHPYFPYLLRLRKQIHKLELVRGVVPQVSRAELEKALSGMQKEGRAFAAGDLSTAESRAEVVDTTLSSFRREYDALLGRLFDLVAVDVTAGQPPALLGAADGAAAVRARTDLPPGAPAIDAASMVRGYRWFLVGSGGNEATAITTEPAWRAYPLTAGPHRIEVVPLGPGDIALGSDTVSIDVEPAHFTGTIEIIGSTPDGSDPVIVLDGNNLGTHGAGRFDIEIASIPEDWLDRYRLRGAGAPGGEPRAWLASGPEALNAGPATTGRSQSILTRARPGSIEADQPLVLNLGDMTLVTVEVADAAGFSIPDADIAVNGPRGDTRSSPTQPEALLLDLKQGESFSVTAERSPPSPPVTATENDVWTSQAEPFIRVELPFFDTGHLDVRGSFAPAGGQTLEIAGGDIESDAFGAGAVASDGSFSLVNTRPLRMEEVPRLGVTLREASDYLIRPVLRPIDIDLVRGHELVVGPYEVERYTVSLDRFAIHIRDASGASLLDPVVRVTVNGSAATTTADGFTGSGEFAKTTDELQVLASVQAAGQTVEGSHSVRLGDIPVWESPVLPDPVEITLSVFGPGRLSIVGSLSVADVPVGRVAPVDVTVQSDLFAGDWTHSVGERFALSSPDPIPVGAAMQVTAVAESDGIRYRAAVTVPTQAGAPTADVGELILRPVVASPDSAGTVADSSATNAPPDSTSAGSGAPPDSSASGGTGGVAGGGIDEIRADLDPLTSSLERERDEAKARCDWAAAAGAQRRIVDLVERWLASVFGPTVPADVQAMMDEMRRESASLDRAEEAERTAEELRSTARVEAAAGQTDQALATLRDAAQLADLPQCELPAIEEAIAALADETARLMREAVDAANQCDFVGAVRYGDQVAAIDPDLEWVQTDLLEFRASARGQERAEQLMDQAAAARASGDLDSAGRFAERALAEAPECDRGWIQGFLNSLVAGPAAQPTVAIDRSLLLLIDASGSMDNDGKIQSAKSAAQHTVRSLGPNVEVALMTYSGGCNGGWRVVQDFTTDRAVMENAIGGISPGGGTPMAPAIGAAQSYLEGNGQGTAGQILLLSDGQNSCGGEAAVRDAGARIRTSSLPIQLDGVGLGLDAGGAAETQLGDLVRAAGTGKQYSANSAEELYRAFRRASLAGQVKVQDPYVDGPSRVRLAELYQTALGYLQQDDFEAARLTFEQAAREHPDAASAQYNLSLAYEAEGRTLSAIEAARRYTEIAPDAPDRTAVEERIRSLEQMQRERPNAIFEPGRCPQLYAWARAEAARVREPAQRALAYSIMTAAQRGDCEAASRDYEAYLTRYGR